MNNSIDCLIFDRQKIPKLILALSFYRKKFFRQNFFYFCAKFHDWQFFSQSFLQEKIGLGEFLILKILFHEIYNKIFYSAF